MEFKSKTSLEEDEEEVYASRLLINLLLSYLKIQEQMSKQKVLKSIVHVIQNMPIFSFIGYILDNRQQIH